MGEQKLNFEYNPEQLFVVGIAASAGGIRPMQELLAHASCHGSMSFVIVSHVSRTGDSDLPAILERASNITAVEIQDGMSIDNCKLYVIPRNKYVQIVGRTFRLSQRPEKAPNNSADVFFESLAKEYKENSIGVVLSGSSVGADGSEGVRAIKRAGGHTYAQLPDTAAFPDMPKLAIETGCIDTVNTAEFIGHELSLVAWAK